MLWLRKVQDFVAIFEEKAQEGATLRFLFLPRPLLAKVQAFQNSVIYSCVLCCQIGSNWFSMNPRSALDALGAQQPLNH